MTQKRREQLKLKAQRRCYTCGRPVRVGSRCPTCLAEHNSAQRLSYHIARLQTFIHEEYTTLDDVWNRLTHVNTTT